jgi:ubiquinone biosynthesis protein UbiJ
MEQKMGRLGQAVMREEWMMLVGQMELMLFLFQVQWIQLEQKRLEEQPQTFLECWQPGARPDHQRI